jgi:hypothetical protein
MATEKETKAKMASEIEKMKQESILWNS